MATNSETEINLKTLQRVDSNITEILDNASQVAIYKYDSKLEKWEGTDVEGTLFLYRRSLYPCHGFIIVNRLNTTNFVESITSDMQFQLQEPYLLYKNHSGDIIGSWFYERKDLQRISKKIQKIVLKQSAVPKRQRCASESESLPVGKEGGQDIMTLLSQAHKEYMKNVQPHIPKSAPVDVNHLSTYSEKETLEKSVGSFDTAVVRSSSQEEYPVSPRRRFRSTGSFDTKGSYELSLGNVGKIQNLREDESRNQNEKDAKSSCSDWTAPTKLSPLFSHNEIGSPLSDVEFLNASPSEDHSNFKTVQRHSKSFENAEWKKNMGINCDTHFTAMKQSLKSHIQENPKVMLKIHEAYVSSLRSLFSKD